MSASVCRQRSRRLTEGVDEHYRLILEVAAGTGARLGEVLGLVWADVDLQGESIQFTSHLDHHGRRRDRHQRFAWKPACARSAAASPGAISTRRRERRAGLEAVVDPDGQVIRPAPTFHTLRHSHASELIAAGWDMESVSGRLGHANVATTQRLYVHEFDAAQRSDERRASLAQLEDGSGYGSSIEQSVAAQGDSSRRWRA